MGSRSRRSCGWKAGCFLCLVLLFGMALNCFAYIAASQAIAHLQPEEIARALGPFEPFVVETLCPHSDFLLTVMDDGILAMLLREIGSKICRSGAHKRSRMDDRRVHSRRRTDDIWRSVWYPSMQTSDTLVNPR